MRRLRAMWEAYVFGSAIFVPNYVRVENYETLGEAIREPHKPPFKSAAPQDSGADFFGSIKAEL